MFDALHAADMTANPRAFPGCLVNVPPTLRLTVNLEVDEPLHQS
jgi:hypothetical protein